MSFTALRAACFPRRCEEQPKQHIRNHNKRPIRTVASKKASAEHERYKKKAVMNIRVYFKPTIDADKNFGRMPNEKMGRFYGVSVSLETNGQWYASIEDADQIPEGAKEFITSASAYEKFVAIPSRERGI